MDGVTNMEIENAEIDCDYDAETNDMGSPQNNTETESEEEDVTAHSESEVWNDLDGNLVTDDDEVIVEG